MQGRRQKTGYVQPKLSEVKFMAALALEAASPRQDFCRAG